MTVNARPMKLGGFDIRLSEDAPKRVRETVDFFGHVAVLPSEVSDPEVHGDDLLDQARYVGVVREVPRDESLTIAGSGMEFWLGDEDDKGEVIEAEKSYSSETFANVVRDLLPAAVQEGTLHSVSGSYTGSHQWETPRKAISYVCGAFDSSGDVEYRVNPDGTLDAGHWEDLYGATPTAVIVRKGAGNDLDLDAVKPRTLKVVRDAKDYTTRVVVLAEGSGDTTATGSADVASVDYKDLHGNDVVRTRTVNESATSTGNADGRAQLHLNRFKVVREKLTLRAEDFDTEGTIRAGYPVYVYDPDSGLVDESVEVRFQGKVIHPMTLRVAGVTFPVREGMGVYYRADDGTWTDLTPYVDHEGGSVDVEVSDFIQGTAQPSGDIQDRTNAGDDATVPDAPTIDATSTSSYEDDAGRTRAEITVDWSEPLNTDGSSITDGNYYEIRWKRATVTDWSSTAVGFDTTVYTIAELVPALTYDIEVRAVDRFGNEGAWASTQVVSSEDTTAPSTPTAPTVAANPLTLQVEHDLTRASDGASLERDLDHLEIHVSTTSGFTPDSTTLETTVTANAADIDAGVSVFAEVTYPSDDTRYVKVRAVDRSGNVSSASAEASGSANLVDTANIQNAAITNAKIGNLEVDDAKISDVSASKLTADALVSGEWMESANYDGTDVGTGDATQGWRIEADGAAEFQNVTVRGTIEADTGYLDDLDVTGLLTLLGSSAAFRSSTGTRRVAIEPDDGLYTYHGSSDIWFKQHTSGTDPTGLRITAFDGTNSWTGLVVQQDGSVALPSTSDADGLTVHQDGTGFAFVVRRADVGKRFQIDREGRAVGTSGFPAVTARNRGDNRVLLKLDSDRPWSFVQRGTGSGTDLELHQTSGGSGKAFVISDSNRNIVASFTPEGTDKLNVNGNLRADDLFVDNDVTITNGLTVQGTDGSQLTVNNAIAQFDTGINVANIYGYDSSYVKFQEPIETVQATGDGNIMLRWKFDSDWTVRQSGDGSSAALAFRSEAASKWFRFEDSDGTIAFEANSDGRTNHRGDAQAVPDATHNCGTSDWRWNAVWAQDGTINTSDPEYKTDVADLPADGTVLDVARNLRTVVFKWADGGERWHAGILADDLRDTVKKHTSFDDLAAWVDPAVTGDDGPMGIRWHEVGPLLLRALKDLANEVDGLKAKHA